MPENKKHHYVPRFYLERFSEDKTRISFYNFQSEKYFFDKPIDPQCQKPYLYGKDPTIEKILGDIEGLAAETFRDIIKHQTTPLYRSYSHHIMTLFLIAQLGRTISSGEYLNNFGNLLMRNILRDDAGSKGINIDHLEFSCSKPELLSVSNHISQHPLILDLKSTLLTNNTSVNFITSDSPVCLYNQLKPMLNSISNTGLNSKGLQLFFPIDKKNCIHLYDGSIYSVKGSNKRVLISDINDVHNINRLQACHARNNIYFYEQKDNIDRLITNSMKYRKPRKITSTSVKTDRSEIYITTKTDIDCQLKLSFTHIKKSAKKWKNKFRKSILTMDSIVRNPTLSQDYDRFREAASENSKETFTFFEFLLKKYGHDEIIDNLVYEGLIKNEI